MRIAIVALLAASLSACGGGGGNPSTPRNDSGGAATVAPLDPPAPPVVDYIGNTSAAMFNDQSVGALADTMYIGMFFSTFLAGQDSDLLGSIDENVPGPDGGFVHVTGNVADDHTGWVQYEYFDYQSEGITRSGIRVFEILQVNNGQQDALSRVSYHRVNARDDVYDQTLTGSLTRRSTPARDQLTFTGTILLEDHAASTALMLEDIELIRTTLTDGDEFTGRGRAYHQSHGWMDFEFQEPWGFERDGRIPHHGGAIIARSSSAQYFQIVPLTPSIVSLQYTSGANPAIDRTARLSWDASFRGQLNRATNEPPTADAGPSRYVLPGTRVSLNGSFSDHRGARFLAYHWTLLFKPPGSATALDDPSRARPEVIVDLPGRYLFQLEVSDGLRSDRDFVVLTVDASADSPLLVEAQLEPDRAIELGDVVEREEVLVTQIDFRDRGVYDLEIVRPDRAQGGQLGDIVGTFVTIIYQSSGQPLDFRATRVSSPEVFAPVVYFPAFEDPGLPVIADLDGDSVDELIVSRPLLGSGQIHIYRWNGETSFQAPIVLNGGAGGRVVVGDLSRDDRPDIVTDAFSGITVFVQQPDGSFTPQTASSDCGNVGFDVPRSLFIADLDSDGLNDVVRSCGRVVEFFPQEDAGGLGRGVYVGTYTTNGDMSFALGDLNGDALTDLVVGTVGGASDETNVSVRYGSEDGTLGPAVFIGGLTRHRRRPAVAVGDLNGDGRDDLVYSIAEAFLTPAPPIREIHVLHQNGSGLLEETQVLDVSPEEIEALGLEDIDRDGRVDILRSGTHLEGVSVHYQHSDGAFGAVVSDSLFLSPRIVPGASGDVNGDGLLDLANLGYGSSIALLLGTE